LRSVLQERCSIFVEAEDEAAFYGPKVDVQMKNVNGKEDTACTNQYDFVMPKRFGMIFTNQHGEDEEPVVIHRASLGALERTIAFLIEHFAGAFPVWLSPVQAVVIPINSDQVVYAKLIEEKLKEKSVRVELWDQTDSMQKRIRNAEAQKIPYIIVVGEKEAHSDNISLRVRGKIDRGTIKADKFITEVLSKIQSKSLEL
jgi:threonyl-tRNA synthetase